jgi:hypothetical protein
VLARAGTEIFLRYAIDFTVIPGLTWNPVRLSKQFCQHLDQMYKSGFRPLPKAHWRQPATMRFSLASDKAMA